MVGLRCVLRFKVELTYFPCLTSSGDHGRHPRWWQQLGVGGGCCPLRHSVLRKLYDSPRWGEAGNGGSMGGRVRVGSDVTISEVDRTN